MDEFLAAIEAGQLARTLRVSRWGYAGVSAAHILGIALLIGATVPLNLRILGLWPDIARATAARLLAPTALAGLILAVTAGAALFSVRATEYAALTVFQAKLALIAVAALSALWASGRYGWHLERATTTELRPHALISLACWLGALLLGRLIAFVD